MAAFETPTAKYDGSTRVEPGLEMLMTLLPAGIKRDAATASIQGPLALISSVQFQCFADS